MMSQPTVRPTKKQREMLNFITSFIKEHGYSPSYREIMDGLQYNSVATVALHVNNLIRRGHLLKRDHSARSLEVVAGAAETDNATDKPNQWFIDKLEAAFETAKTEPTTESLTDLKVLIEALKVMGYPQEAEAFTERLNLFDKA